MPAIAPGIYVTEPVPSASIAAGAQTASTNPPIEPQTPKEKSFWSKASPAVHGALGIASFVPGLSVVTGAADAGIYAMEGQFIEAGIAGASMIPGGKIVTTAGKVAKGAATMAREAGAGAKIAKGAKEAEEAAKAARLAKEAEEAAKLEKTREEAARVRKAEDEAVKASEGKDGAKIKGRKNIEKGKCGEWLAKMDMASQGFDQIVEVQNNSGHGVDLIGRNSATGEVTVWEVKTTEGTSAPSLSKDQARLGGEALPKIALIGLLMGGATMARCNLRSTVQKKQEIGLTKQTDLRLPFPMKSGKSLSMMLKRDVPNIRVVLRDLPRGMPSNQEYPMDMQREVGRLRKKVGRWMSEWVVNEVMIRNFRDKPPLLYEAYLDSGDELALLASRADKVSTWHFNRFANSIMNEMSPSLEDFSLSARYALAKVQFEEAFADAEQGGSLLLDYAGFYLSLAALAGWRSQTLTIGRSLHRGLDTSFLDLRHTNRHEKGVLYRHFWFLMHLFCDFDNLKLSTSLYSYPRDMNPYSNVLAQWRTEDHKRVQDFVSAMADFHIKEARTTAHDEIAEFDTEDRMIFPYEILVFLRLREWIGLSNPASFEHPLMNQPFANLPSSVPLRWPDTPLLDSVINKFRQEYPGSFTVG